MWYTHGHEVRMFFFFGRGSLLSVFLKYSGKEAFTTEEFLWQRRMMDAMITGLDQSLVGFK
jgi:hypothetical protein